MQKLMPQEFEVWYLIPALRREIANILITDNNLKQKEVASLLGLTEAAISQYRKSKRAQQLKFTQAEMVIIKETTKKMMLEKDQVMRHMHDLSKKMMGSSSICTLHASLDKDIPKDCKICDKCFE